MKADLKGATDIDKSNTNLAGLKTKVDNLDLGKLKTFLLIMMLSKICM